MECVKAKKSDEWILDLYIHIMILVVVLSIAFWVLIAPTEKQSFETEITNQLNTSVKNIIAKNPDVIKAMKPQKNILETMSKYYSKPDSTTKDYNTWLKRVNIIIIVVLIVNFFILWILLRFSCGRCVPVKKIFMENIFLFLCIGIIEVIFFLKVASKFVPVTPSFMTNTFIDGLKKEL
jgi:hypothetical protein